MKRPSIVLLIGVVLLVLVASACNRAPRKTNSKATAKITTEKISAALVGSYTCLENPPPGPEDPPDVLELRRDGTALFTHRNPVIPKRAIRPGFNDPGFWSAEGDSGVLTLRDGEPRDKPFTVEGNRIRFQNGTECTRA